MLTPVERREKIKILERALVENKLHRLRLELEESEIRDDIIELQIIDGPVKALAQKTIKALREAGRYIVH